MPDGNYFQKTKKKKTAEYMFSKLANLISQPNIAIDLGTANTRIYGSMLGKITENPSVIHLVNNGSPNTSDKYLADINRNIVKIPLRGGVIVDIKNAITLLKPLVKKTTRFMAHPVSLACAPTDTSEKERNYLSGAILHAGASHVSIIPEVWAAAIGAGMDVSQPSAQVLIDMGDGVTDMAVIREGRIIYASAVRIACGDLQKAIRSAIMTKHRIRLFAHEAERLTHEIASMSNQQESSHGFINAGGVDMNKRCEVTIKIDSNDVISAMAPVVNKIIKMIETGLQKLPENIYCEIIESGICLTGGGACIKGIDRLIALRTRMDVRIANDPMHSVINGAIQTLDYWKGEKCWWKNIVWPDLVT